MNNRLGKSKRHTGVRVILWLLVILVVLGTGAYLSYRYLINPEAFAAVIKPPEITNLKDIKNKDTGKWEVEVSYPSKGDAVPPGEPTIAELHRSDQPDSGYIFILEAPMWGFPKGETIKIYDESGQLVEGRTYYYKFVLKGVSSEAKSVKVGEAGDEDPPAPKNLAADPGNQTVILTWEAGSKTKTKRGAVNSGPGSVKGIQIAVATEKGSSAGEEVIGDGRLYNVYRGTKTSKGITGNKLDNGGRVAVPSISYVLITENPIKGYEYSDTGLTNGTTYYYYVTEVENSKESNPSNKVSAVPNEEGTIKPPLNLSAKSNWYSVSLSWDQVKGADGYRIYYGKTSGDYGKPIEIRKVTTEKDQQETYDVGIDKIDYGIYYYFTVTALKGTEESAKPDPVYERALIPGDLDKDKDVDPEDFAVWVTWWLEFQKSESTIAKTTLEGDFNGDGKVDPEDFAVWVTYWLDYQSESSKTTSTSNE